MFKSLTCPNICKISLCAVKTKTKYFVWGKDQFDFNQIGIVGNLTQRPSGNNDFKDDFTKILHSRSVGGTALTGKAAQIYKTLG